VAARRAGHHPDSPKRGGHSGARISARRHENASMKSAQDQPNGLEKEANAVPLRIYEGILDLVLSLGLADWSCGRLKFQDGV
jgi:hypothetical protein